MPVTTTKPLSPRESIISGRLSAGQDMKEIAFDLDITYSTVHTAARHAARKLGYRSPGDLRGGAPVAKRCYELAMAAGHVELALQIAAEFRLTDFD